MEPALLGVALDSSVIFDAERSRLTAEQFLRAVRATYGEVEIVLSAVTFAELAHCVARVCTEDLRIRHRGSLRKKSPSVHLARL